MKQAHCQVAQWYAALESDPPPLDLCDYGWDADGLNNSLSTVPVRACVLLEPDNILWLIQCGCESDTACKSRNCRWIGQQIPCSIFCDCTDESFCFSKFTSKPPDDDEGNGDIVQEND